MSDEDEAGMIEYYTHSYRNLYDALETQATQDIPWVRIISCLTFRHLF